MSSSPTQACLSLIELMKWVFEAREMSYNEAMDYIEKIPAGIVQNEKWLLSIYNSNSDHGVWRSARIVAKSFFLEEVK